MQAKDAELKKKDNDYAALREQMKPLTVCVCVCVCANRYIKVLYTETDRHTDREKEREQERCTQMLVRWKSAVS